MWRLSLAHLSLRSWVGSVTGPLELDARIGVLASGQMGVVARDQLLGLGASADCIKRRVRAGSLIRITPGVFRTAACPRSWQQRALAASMWIGDRGAVSGRAAAALHRLDGFGPPVEMDVLTTGSARSRQTWLVVHRSPYWLDVDRCVVRGISVTSIERTLIELAGDVREAQLETALEDALRRRAVHVDAIWRRLADLPNNQPGRGVLLRLLDARGTAPPAESGLEVKVIRLLRAEGYPAPIRQKVIDDEGRFVGRVDLVFPSQRLIIEVDSFRYHFSRLSFEHDRARRNALGALGWLVIHITNTMLKEPQRGAFLRDLKRAYLRPL